MSYQAAKMLVYSFLDEDDPAQYERVQTPESRDDRNCLRIIVYNQPPFVMHVPYLDDWDTMQRSYSGTISFMMRSFVDRANISCIQEVGPLDNADFYGALIRHHADLAVGSIYVYPPNVRQFQLFTPQFVWENALVGREKFHQADVSTGVLEFYASSQWIFIGITILLLTTVVTWARRITRERIKPSDHFIRLASIVFEYVCMHLSHQRVAYWPVTDLIGRLDRLHWKRLKYVKLLLDLRFQLLWIWFSWMMYSIGSNELIGLLMSPLASDRFTSLLDVIKRNSSELNVIYWPGAALDQLLHQNGRNASLANYQIIFSEQGQSYYDLFDAIAAFRALVVTTEEICRSIVMGVLSSYPTAAEHVGLYYVIDRKSVSAQLGFVPMRKSDRIPAVWLAMYQFISDQHQVSGLFQFETSIARERIRRFIGAAIGPIQKIEQLSRHYMAEGGHDASSFAPLGLQHLGLFTLIIIGMQLILLLMRLVICCVSVLIKKSKSKKVNQSSAVFDGHPHPHCGPLCPGCRLGMTRKGEDDARRRRKVTARRWKSVIHYRECYLKSLHNSSNSARRQTFDSKSINQ